MDIGKQRKPSVDAKYLHAFSPSPLSQNGQHLRHPVEGNESLYGIVTRDRIESISIYHTMKSSFY